MTDGSGLAEWVPPKVPAGSKLDTFRAVVESAAQLEPFGVGAAAVGLLGVVWETSLAKNTREFHERVVESFVLVGQAITDNVVAMNEQVALAALTTGTLAAARSASEEHLDWLATATARAMATPGDRESAYAFQQLRVLGDLNKSHIRLLQMYADPDAFAAEAEISGYEHDPYDPERMVNELDPQLAVDMKLVALLVSDLRRHALVGDDASFVTVIDGGDARGHKMDEVSTFGTDLLSFIRRG